MQFAVHSKATSARHADNARACLRVWGRSFNFAFVKNACLVTGNADVGAPCVEPNSSPGPEGRVRKLLCRPGEPLVIHSNQFRTRRGQHVSFIGLTELSPPTPFATRMGVQVLYSSRWGGTARWQACLSHDLLSQCADAPVTFLDKRAGGHGYCGVNRCTDVN